jgi:prepilin-type N-terminal cleavage/methylation domain-containing protein/prepilin-type processing-associated H-X9-DG protein
MAKTTSCRAFTLIELLVVIAIIGVLAAIAMGAVNRVIERAHGAKCTSNLKQLTTAIMLYSADNNGRLPGPLFRSIRHPSVKPTVSYLSTTRDPNKASSRDWIIPYLNGSESVWKCPANEAAFKANAGRLVYLLNNQNSTDPVKFFGDPDTKEQPRTLAAVRAAGQNTFAYATGLSEIWMISDIDGENFPPGVGGQFALPKSVPPPHNGGRNYSFLDGHVEFRKKPKDPKNLQPGEWPPNF